MADASHTKQLNSSHPANVITYGHFGTANYSKTLKRWLFLRGHLDTGHDNNGDEPDKVSGSSAFPFRLIENSVRQIGGPVDGQAPKIDDVPLSEKKVQSRLFKVLRDTTAGTSQIRNESRMISNSSFSEALDKAKLSDSIAFGGAVLLDQVDKRSILVPIVAVVVGSNAGSVKLVRLEREVVRLRDVNGIENTYNIPRFQGLDEIWWTGNGEQIQQICFAAAYADRNYQSTWMAIRQPSSTTIFHPLVHRVPVASLNVTGGTSFRRQPPSILDFNQILSIPTSRTGGHAHADVAFHPQDHETLALIDDHGNWSIWKIEGKRPFVTRILYRASLQLSRKLYSWIDVKRPPEIPTYYDGWHKVRWLETSTGDVHGLFVCNRITAMTYDLRGTQLEQIDMRLGAIRLGHQILDVKKSTSFPGHIFALTSTYVLLFHLRTEDTSKMSKPVSLNLLLAWQHFRGRPDLSLQLHLIETEKITTALLKSQANTVATAIRFGSLDDFSSSIVSLTDPDKVNLPTNLIPFQGTRHLSFHCLQIRRRPDLCDDLDNPLLVKLFVQDLDLKIFEALYVFVARHWNRSQQSLTSTAIPLPFKRSLLVKSSKYAELDLDDFIVDDSRSHDFESLDFAWQSPPESASRLQQPGLDPKVNLDWTEIYTLASGLITDDDVIDFNATIQHLMVKIHEVQEPKRTLQLLSHMVETETRLGDIEDDSQALQALNDYLSMSTSLQLGIGQSQTFLSLGSQFVSVSQLYSRLVEGWLLTLPGNIPDHTRVNIERTIRSLVAELSLASIAIRPRVERLVESTDGPRTLNTITEENSGLHDSGSVDQASFSHHEPVQSSLPEDPACVRLRAYGPLTKPIVPISTSPALVEMLAHLPTDPDADPSNYDWRTIERDHVLLREQTAQLADPKARQRAERLAAARRRKEEAHKRLSQAAEQARMASMYVNPRGTEIQSSQVGELSQDSPTGGVRMAMTQPERGAYGTRAVGPGKGKKDKGKKRTQGF